MHLLDVKEWFMIADQDFDSAIFLTNMYPKPLEIICYHCAQATEKYLKGFLEYNDIIPEKTHDLIKLINKCISIDESFKQLIIKCKHIDRFTNQIRYIHRKDATEDEMELALKYTEIIKNFPAFNIIREQINALIL